MNGRYYWSYDYVSKLILVNVNETTGNLSVYGTVDHSDLYTQGENNRWWNEYNIRRSIFMGDYVYAISSAGITATNLTTLEESARIQILQDSQSSDEVFVNEDDSTSSDEEGEGESPSPAG